MRKFRFALALLALGASPALAAGWGSVEGQFVLAGPVPDVAPIPVAPAHVAACGVSNVPNDAMAFDKETGGIANIVLYMRKAPEIHPDLKVSAEKKVEFDQKDCRFLPHVMVVRTDQVVVCKSSDSTAHNVHTNPFRNTPVNQTVQPNDQNGLEVKMSAAESLPVKVVCDIHPWMTAWWVVVDHPYAAVTDEKGNFKIENLPEGDHEFIVWHDTAGYIDRKFVIKVKAGETTKIEPQKVPLASFKK